MTTLYVLLHSTGLIMGGAVTGFVLGFAGRYVSLLLSEPVLVVGAGAAAIAYGLMDSGVWALPALGRHWQVPRPWLSRYPFVFTYWAYGFLLGVGFLTLAPVGSFTTVAILEMTTQSVLWGACVGASYGAGRAFGFTTGLRYRNQSTQYSVTAIVSWLNGRTLVSKRPLGRVAMFVGVWLVAVALT